MIRIFSTIIALLAVAFIGLSLLNKPQTTEEKPLEKDVAQANHVVDIYTITNGRNQPLRPDGHFAEVPVVERLYNGVHSLGILPHIAEQYNDQLPDFIIIGDKIADRDNYLTQIGFKFKKPEHFFKTEILDIGERNGELRVSVISFVGTDGLPEPEDLVHLRDYGIGARHEVELSEIWRIDPDDGPVLLERVHIGTRDGKWWFHMGLETFAEHPPVASGGGMLEGDIYPLMGQ